MPRAHCGHRGKANPPRFLEEITQPVPNPLFWAPDFQPHSLISRALSPPQSELGRHPCPDPGSAGRRIFSSRVIFLFRCCKHRNWRGVHAVPVHLLIPVCVQKHRSQHSNSAVCLVCVQTTDSRMTMHTLDSSVKRTVSYNTRSNRRPGSEENLSVQRHALVYIGHRSIWYRACNMPQISRRRDRNWEQL